MQLTLALLPGHAAASEHSMSPPLTCPVMKANAKGFKPA